MSLPPNFQLYHSWLVLPREWVFETLMRELPWEQPNLKMFGKEIPVPRLLAFMGSAPYEYSGVTHAPAGWHPIVKVILDAIEAKTGRAFNSCLANLYRSGQDGVGWHSDDEASLGPEPVIASVSLGATREFVVRPKNAGPRWSADLHDGDLLVMSGDSQNAYRHCVPKTERLVGPRINLTFRLVHYV